MIDSFNISQHTELVNFNTIYVCMYADFVFSIWALYIDNYRGGAAHRLAAGCLTLAATWSHTPIKLA